jgi:hypothetical protein
MCHLVPVLDWGGCEGGQRSHRPSENRSSPAAEIVAICRKDDKQETCKPGVAFWELLHGMKLRKTFTETCKCNPHAKHLLVF